MSKPISLAPEGIEALQHLTCRRDVNTVIFRCEQAPRPSVILEREGNLTHDELVRALPADAARLAVHELAFATSEGSRRSETLLILWMPSNDAVQEEDYTVACEALKQFLPNAHVHLTARRADHLDYRRLVALAG
ncbi:hypothetical protein ACIPY6_41175 [Streptomyces sp. NPDC090054]|uniref:hypothetical protein n=1 Tax=Streptomyces sp. NPDC090054 TaxID=3365933 RepID=UPI0038208AE7